MSELFSVSETNPNDAVGGGGCLGSSLGEIKDQDCEGPYVIFLALSMESNLSPHPVLCARCLRAAVASLDGEILSAGEKGEPQRVTIEPVTTHDTAESANGDVSLDELRERELEESEKESEAVPEI